MSEEKQPKQSAGAKIKEIKRRTNRKYSTEEKIRIVIEGLRGEESISSLCRKYAIHEALYYKWSKDFMEAGKKRLGGDTERNANSSEVDYLKKENESLKKAVADLFIQNNAIKKSLTGME
jgi:transposase